MNRRLGALVPVLLAATGMACEKANTGGLPVRDVTLERFGALRWIAGTWQGTAITAGGEDIGEPFYEVWRALDDSSFVMHRFDDSSLTGARDSTRVELRGGMVFYRSTKPVMLATGLASRGATFFPEGESRGGVTFSTQFACLDTLLPATSRCPTRPNVSKRRWHWIATWHTAPVVFGSETVVRQGERFSYEPVAARDSMSAR